MSGSCGQSPRKWSGNHAGSLSDTAVDTCYPLAGIVSKTFVSGSSEAGTAGDPPGPAAVNGPDGHGIVTDGLCLSDHGQ